MRRDSNPCGASHADPCPNVATLSESPQGRPAHTVARLPRPDLRHYFYLGSDVADSPADYVATLVKPSYCLSTSKHAACIAAAVFTAGVGCGILVTRMRAAR